MFLMGRELLAFPSSNPNRFVGCKQNRCLLSLNLCVCIGLFCAAYPQVTW